MGLIVYPALVDEAGANDFTATFPDFGDLSVRASSPPELLLAARERLLQVLKALEKAGDTWPKASSLAEVGARRTDRVSGVIWVDVEVEDTPVRVTISMGERLLARIDAAAEEHAMTRSGYLAAAARRQMATAGSPLDGATGQRIFDEIEAAGRRIQETLGPDSPVGRTLAELDAIAVDGLRRVAGGVSSVMQGRRASRSGAPFHDPEGASPKPQADPAATVDDPDRQQP